jgi:hypothetical protein
MFGEMWPQGDVAIGTNRGGWSAAGVDNTLFTFRPSSTIFVICTTRCNIEILYILLALRIYPLRMVQE